MNEYAGMLYTTPQHMIEAMVWDWLSSCGRDEGLARRVLAEAMDEETGDGGDTLAAEFMASGWVADRDDVHLGDAMDAVVELWRVITEGDALDGQV